MGNASRICAIPAQTGNGFRTAGSGSYRIRTAGTSGSGGERRQGRGRGRLVKPADPSPSCSTTTTTMGARGTKTTPGPIGRKRKAKPVYTHGALDLRPCRRLASACRVVRPAYGSGGAGEAGGDGGVVHGVVEGLGLRHPRPQLAGLLLRQAPHELPACRAARVVVLRHRHRRDRGRGLEVVGLPRPPQQRRPPPAALRRPSSDAPRTGRGRGPRRRRAGGEGDGDGGGCARCRRHSDRSVASPRGFGGLLCWVWGLAGCCNADC